MFLYYYVLKNDGTQLPLLKGYVGLEGAKWRVGKTDEKHLQRTDESGFGAWGPRSEGAIYPEVDLR